MTTLPETRSTLQREIAALTDDLSPVTTEAVAACIDAMKRAGMAVPTGIPAGELVAAYALALRTVPKAGLRDAMRRIRQGEYADMDYAFMPRPAELARRARAEAGKYREDLVRKREAHAALAAAPAAKDPATVARVRRLVAGFRHGSAA